MTDQLIPSHPLINTGTQQVRNWCECAGLQYLGLDVRDQQAVVRVEGPAGPSVLTFSELYQLAHPLTLAPEQRLRNICAALLTLIDATPRPADVRPHLDAIHLAAGHLARCLDAHLLGVLPPLVIRSRLRTDNNHYRRKP